MRMLYDQINVLMDHVSRDSLILISSTDPYEQTTSSFLDKKLKAFWQGQRPVSNDDIKHNLFLFLHKSYSMISKNLNES